MTEDAFSNFSDKVDQTKLVLLYNEPKSFFSKSTYIYQYYYDNKNPIYTIYGGVNLDSLTSFYKTRQNIYRDSYLTAIAGALNIPVDSLLKRRDPDTGSISLTKQELEVVNKKKPVIKIKGYNSIPFNIKDFSSVEPFIIYSINYPPQPKHFIQLTEEFQVNEKIQEAISHRDFNFYNDF